jgi:hypothetical protein
VSSTYSYENPFRFTFPNQETTRVSSTYSYQNQFFQTDSTIPTSTVPSSTFQNNIFAFTWSSSTKKESNNLIKDNNQLFYTQPTFSVPSTTVSTSTSTQASTKQTESINKIENVNNSDQNCKDFDKTICGHFSNMKLCNDKHFINGKPITVSCPKSCNTC